MDKKTYFDRVFTLAEVFSPHLQGPRKAFQVSVILNLFQDLDETLKHRGQSDVQGDVRRKLGKLCAFTLAEVLITLGIIGVVAAITMPSVISNYRERQNIVALKKTVSILENAYKLAVYENGSSDFGYLDAEYVRLEDGSGVYNKNSCYNSDLLFKALSKHLKILKDCGTDGKDGCWAEIVYNPFNSNTYKLLNMQGNARRFFVLNDGISVGIMKDIIYIDVNGLKGPNTLGKDVFQLKLEENKIGRYDAATGAPNCYTNAFTCADWVLGNDNMDYLHCSDLSWDGKHKCN